MSEHVHPVFRPTLDAFAPATTVEEAAPTDLQKINQEWVLACESAMFDCPAEFVPQFTSIMFTGQRLITEARITAQIDAARTETLNELERQTG